MIVTVAPTIWNRMGKLWQKHTIPAFLPPNHVFNTVKSYFFGQVNGWVDIRTIQQNIYNIYHYKLRISRLKWWIVRRRIGKEPG